jgi:hypothetical protein
MTLDKCGSQGIALADFVPTKLAAFLMNVLIAWSAASG